MTWLTLALGLGLGLALTKSVQSSEYSTYSAAAKADERRRTAFQATEAGFSRLPQPTHSHPLPSSETWGRKARRPLSRVPSKKRGGGAGVYKE